MAFYATIGGHRVDLDHVTAIGSKVRVEGVNPPTLAIYTDRARINIDDCASLKEKEIKILEARGFLNVGGDTYVNPAHVMTVQSDKVGEASVTRITLGTLGRTFPNRPPVISTDIPPRTLVKKMGGFLDITPNNNAEAYVRPECVDYVDFTGNYCRTHVNGHLTGSDVIAIEIKQNDAKKILDKMQKVLPLIEVNTNGSYYWVNAANVTKVEQSYRKDPNDTAIFYASSDNHPSYATGSPADIHADMQKATEEFVTHRPKSHAAAVG